MKCSLQTCSTGPSCSVCMCTDTQCTCHLILSKTLHTLFMVIHMLLVLVCGMATHTHDKCSTCTSPLPLLFRYPRSLLVDPTPYTWEETWPSVEGGGHQTSSKEQRYTNHLLAEVLTHHFVTTVFTVLHHTLVWVSYTCARTHQGSPARPAVF